MSITPVKVEMAKLTVLTANPTTQLYVGQPLCLQLLLSAAPCEISTRTARKGYFHLTFAWLLLSKDLISLSSRPPPKKVFLTTALTEPNKPEL